MKYVSFSKLKLSLFLLMSIFLVVVYSATIPLDNIHEKSYTLHFANIVYSFIILIAILVMNFEDCSKKDWGVAIGMGVISLGITIPINITGIISSLCVVVTYLASKSLYGKYSTRIEFFNAKSIKGLLEDLEWIIIISGFFVGIKIIKLLYIVFTDLNQLDFHPTMLAQAIGAAVSEEIIFRLFIFSVIVNISKGEVQSYVLSVLIMVIPFSLFHLIEVGIYNGIPTAFFFSLFYWLLSIALTVLALKRNLFSAIVVHFIYNLVNSILS